MTPTKQPDHLTITVLGAWSFTIVCPIALWRIGYAGPTVSVVFLALSMAGTILLLAWGFLAIRNAARKIAAPPTS